MASHASYNITIDHTSAAAGSDHSSSITDGEDSSGTGVQVSPTSVGGDHEYSDPLDENEEESWVVYPDEIGPSDSASRPRTSNQHRPIVEAPRPESARRQSAHRQRPNERVHHHPVPRARRPHLPTSSRSVDSNEEWPAYGRGPPQYYGRAYAHYGHAAAASPPNYAPSYSSAQGYTPFPTTNVPPPGQQLVPFASPPVPYNYQPYPAAAGGQAPGYFPPVQHAAPNMANPMMPHPGAPPYTGQEMMHHTQAAQFYPYPPQGYPMPQAVGPPAMYHPYPAIFSPSPAPTTNTPPPSADNSKDDEKFARIEKLFLDQKAEQAAKEAAAIKAAEEAAAKAAAEKKYAEDVAAAAAAAAAAATEEAEKKAAEKAAEEAVKAKAAAEEAEKKAAEAEKKAADAVAAAPPPPPPPPEEKKKPIRFKDAVGRKFSFPFHLCSTWDYSATNAGLRAQGMDYLIRQAFLHVEVIGPHVAEGHYDLVGPNGEIILPQVWETVIEPDWTITMHMWPMPEPPPPPDPPPEAVVDTAVIEVPPKDGKDAPPPPPPPPGVAVVPKKPKNPKPSPFLAWTAGKSKNSKSLKVARKPEDVMHGFYAGM
ncbi:MAG: hypothetical protein Q9166_003179 [cf. Caloplaca sp. 2 TL-2023]